MAVRLSATATPADLAMLFANGSVLCLFDGIAQNGRLRHDSLTELLFRVGSEALAAIISDVCPCIAACKW